MSQQQIAEWIENQDDGLNYWEIVKVKFAQEFPEFKEWLKEQALKEKKKTGTDN